MEVQAGYFVQNFQITHVEFSTRIVASQDECSLYAYYHQIHFPKVFIIVGVAS